MPSIMVIPSLDLCKRYACVNQVTVYGSIDTVADYAKAVQIEDIKLAIASMIQRYIKYFSFDTMNFYDLFFLIALPKYS